MERLGLVLVVSLGFARGISFGEIAVLGWAGELASVCFMFSSCMFFGFTFIVFIIALCFVGYAAGPSYFLISFKWSSPGKFNTLMGAPSSLLVGIAKDSIPQLSAPG